MRFAFRRFACGRWPGSLASLLLCLFCLVPVGSLWAFDPLSGDLSKDSPQDIRIVTYNHAQNFIQTPSRDAAFNRILTALGPDLICFQEFGSSVTQTTITNRLNAIMPLQSGSWQVHLGLLGGTRTVIASRFPLTLKRTDTIPASSTRGVTLALADLPNATYPRDIYLLGVHLKCCGVAGGSEDASRQASADAIANWLGDARGVARSSGNNIVLAADTPMIALGDFNLVGGPQPENTLITGNIQNEAAYGPDVKGDWDNSNMTDLMPTDPFTSDTFTWQGSASYPPSRLDRFFFTDSVTTVTNSFILNTNTMTPAALAAAGLQAGDTLPDNSSDHLPVAMDVRIVAAPECTTNGECDDGLFCNGQETCNIQNQCQPGTPPVLDDGVTCTVDTCDEAGDVIVHTPDDAFCQNGLFCDGAETCNAFLGCRSGTPPDLDDGIDCTVDTCDESGDRIVHSPDNAYCDDGNPCNGSEICDIGLGACRSIILPPRETLLLESFDAGAGAFSYRDDTFRGTSNPSFAGGAYESAGGLTGGGLRVQVGGNSTNMSGGWAAAFEVTGSPVSVEIEVACRLIANGGYEADEYGEALMSIDNTLIGVAPNDYLARFGGDGNTPAEDMDSGWVSRVFSLSLSAGSHELVVGGFNNKGTASTEITQIYFDNIRVTAFYSTAPDTDTDGIIDSCDNCPAAPNAGQEDDDDDSVGNDCDLCADTVPGATVDAGGCPPIIPGDADRDGDVDSQDCAAFEACASGPAVPYAGQCGNWDFDLDTDVDLYDFAVFQRCFSGADLPADPDCAG